MRFCFEVARRSNHGAFSAVSSILNCSIFPLKLHALLVSFFSIYLQAFHGTKDEEKHAIYHIIQQVKWIGNNGNCSKHRNREKIWHNLIPMFICDTLIDAFLIGSFKKFMNFLSVCSWMCFSVFGMSNVKPTENVSWKPMNAETKVHSITCRLMPLCLFYSCLCKHSLAFLFLDEICYWFLSVCCVLKDEPKLQCLL